MDSLVPESLTALAGQERIYMYDPPRYRTAAKHTVDLSFSPSSHGDLAAVI